MKTLGIAFVVGCCVLGAGRAARAQGFAAEESVFARHAVTVTGILGLGTPVGEAGAEIALAPADWLELSGGIGRGFYGLQLAAMPRVRLHGEGRWALTLGAGYSQGEYGKFDLCFDGPCDTWRGTIAWANLEAGAEFQTEAGFTLRLFGGVGIPLNPYGLSCQDGGSGECATDTRPRVVPFPSGGVAVGWSF